MNLACFLERLLTGRELVLTLISFAALLEAASPKPRRDLADYFAAALNSLGDQLLPADR